jgi:kinetochore protein Mis13/DSN1
MFLTMVALPHSEVEAAEFYKHIEPGLPEPRRMRQLLTWCGTRALGNKPSFATEDSHAKLAAREIQQQLLADFGAKSELSDWFSRVRRNLTQFQGTELTS